MVTMDMISMAFLWFCLLANVQGKDEYDLKIALLKRYLKMNRPVKHANDVVHVKIDLALRSIIDLDAKQQILSSNAWIRMYWNDAHFKWDPKNYSDIQTINFNSSTIWVPDMVLYNSADSKGSGILDNSLKTSIVVSSDGTCSWYCPIILNTECTIDITWFPFDLQICPFKFGLWTYNGLRVNLTNSRNVIDLSDYIPSGEWNLGKSTVTRHVNYFACCPNVPYPDITMEISLIRRTKFFVMNIIWPGILIALLAGSTFLLPPESGERIGLGITNLLAMMVFLLLISESIPPTSDAIPMASHFFTMVVVLSALALIVSCISIKFQHYSGSDVNEISPFIRVFINRHLAALLLIRWCATKDSRKTVEVAKHGINNEAVDATDENDIEHLKSASMGDNNKTTNDLNTQFVKDTPSSTLITEGMKIIVAKLHSIDNEDAFKAEYRKAIVVIDRFFTLFFFTILFVACLAMFSSAPRFWVP